MKINLIKTFCFLASTAFLVTACSTTKLEARFEANPQCKDIVNAKTGALMPCPGTDKAFYREVGLAPPKPVPATNNAVSSASATPGSTPPSAQSATASASSKQLPETNDCKPQFHSKTGVTMPCPSPD